MSHIVVADAQSFLEGTKANLVTLDAVLENEMSVYVLGKLTETYSDPGFGTPSWVDEDSTPELVKMAIAMLYAGWFYDRQYSEVVSEDPSNKSYGWMLRQQAENLIAGIISGAIALAEISPNEPAVAPVFYPTDSSSTYEAVAANTDPNNTSFGPPMFSVGKVF
jgi:hypothetical protein